MQPLILASSSAYRRELLARLKLDFTCHAPDIDESALAGEPPATLVERLACNKARAILQAHPDAVVIGSDQVAALDDQLLTKPMSVPVAHQQLQSCSGREVIFYTGLCITSNQQTLYRLSTTRVKFRELTEKQIHNYISAEMPLDCAGSFKCEGLGIALFERVSSDDPTALIGLPLIALTDLLASFGIAPLGA